jgi:hypothetical protein
VRLEREPARLHVCLLDDHRSVPVHPPASCAPNRRRALRGIEDGDIRLVRRRVLALTRDEVTLLLAQLAVEAADLRECAPPVLRDGDRRDR